MTSQTSLLGAAGEHLVMAELLRRGYIAALAPQGAPNIDIVVTDVDGERACSIQVKTRRKRGSDGGWHMSRKHEDRRGSQLFYCFVDFGIDEKSSVEIYVVPSAVVADALTMAHRAWLKAPGRNRPHNDNKMRRFRPSYTNVCGANSNLYTQGWLERYRAAWSLLKLEPPSQVDQHEQGTPTS
jgi:hypothetical protein